MTDPSGNNHNDNHEPKYDWKRNGTITVGGGEGEIKECPSWVLGMMIQYCSVVSADVVVTGGGGVVIWITV